MKRNEVTKILIALVMLVSGMLVEHDIIYISDICKENNFMLVWYLVAFLIVGREVIKEAATNILSGQVFDENFLMAIAGIGAFLIGEYEEALAVMVFYQTGEMFQRYAVGKSRKSIADLMDIKPETAYVLDDDNVIKQMAPEEVKEGDVIVVKPGEKIPLDGIVIKGNASLDTKALTGESLPRECKNGDEVVSGMVNINGVLNIKVTKKYSQSTVAKILELVENAGSKKAKTEKFITRFARYYTPTVVIMAVVLAVVFPVVEGMMGQGIEKELFSKWIYRALSFLVTSCPCALVISVPLSFFGGIGGAGAKGVLVKGSNYLELLAKCEKVVFDKTGTLTKGNFEVKVVKAEAVEEKKLVYLATLAEYYSNHPISKSLKEYLYSMDKELYKEMTKNAKVVVNEESYEEIAGKGIRVLSKEGELSVGNISLMEGIISKEAEEFGTIVYVALDKKYLGYIVIADEVKTESRGLVRILKKAGIKKTYMLTGDKKNIAGHIADELEIDEFYANLLPGDKVEYMEKILDENSGCTAYVGDGINDAPVLARADIGIAMGALGSDAAIEAADVVLMDDNPKKIGMAIKIAKKTMKIVKQNIVFALTVKAAILILAAVGITSMWAAVFADVGVAFLAILNALRAMKI